MDPQMIRQAFDLFRKRVEYFLDKLPPEDLAKLFLTWHRELNDFEVDDPVESLDQPEPPEGGYVNADQVETFRRSLTSYSERWRQTTALKDRMKRIKLALAYDNFSEPGRRRRIAGKLTKYLRLDSVPGVSRFAESGDDASHAWLIRQELSRQIRKTEEMIAASRN